MCARIARLLLAALFTFIVVTVAAFRYLEWWQALLASAATFLLLVAGAKLVIRNAFNNLGDLAKGLFETKSRVLRGATVQVHSVRPADPPPNLGPPSDEPDAEPEERARVAELRSRAWYEVEVSLFPDPKAAGPMTHWDLDDLRLVPLDAPPLSMDENDADEDRPEFDLWDVRVVVDGEAIAPEGSKFHGPHRLRFLAGVPRDVREVKFQYYFENFGHIRLTPALAR